MGRIRHTIIMGNPRGFVLKKFALIIATWAVVSVLVPPGASAVAEPDRVEEVNCDAVQVVIRVPPQNIDPLVPARRYVVATPRRGLDRHKETDS